jgi:prepilin-type processing-associated H-X9-DG protein
MPRAAASIIKIAAFGLIAGLFLMLFLPSPPHRIKRARRAACANNLKLLNQVFLLYSEKNRGFFPPIDDIKNNFIFSGNLFPNYLTDASIAACPSDPEYSPKKNFQLISTANHPSSQMGEVHPDCITDMSYCYLGWIITNQQGAEAFFDAYEKMSPEDYDKDIVVPEGKGNGGGNIIYRLKSPDKMPTNLKIDPANVPVMWDKPSGQISKFSHVPAGSNVLYLDGHVEFLRFDPSYPQFPATLTLGKLLDERPRMPIPDCDDSHP